MNPPLKVMLLVNRLSVGGAERQLVELAKGLDRQRFYPIVATLYGGQPLERELASREDMRLVSLERRHKYDFTTPAKLVRLLRRERVHIIQPFLTPATFFGLTASMVAGTPVRIGTERCGAHLSVGGVGNRLYTFLEERLIRAADAVVPNSEAGRDYLIARGVRPDKVRVIYNGLNPSRTAVSEDERSAVRRSLALPPDARVVGIVARLDEAKDHETFLRAAAHVREQLPNTYFVIVGEGPLRPRLETRARELGLATRALFVGSQLRVAPFIDCFDVAVLSSCDDEGCSNFLLEAMALGKPVVCTDIGGNRELVTDGKNGFLVPIKHPEGLARSIVAVLTDPARAGAMGEKARQAVHGRFTLEQMVRGYEDLYSGLWSQRTRAEPVPAPEEVRS